METEKNLATPDRVIGILGGMGPEATLDLYLNIIRLTPVKRDQDHIRVLIYSNPKIPDRTLAIEDAGESPVPSLIESARILEKGGAGIIAMPCNAAHYYLPEIQREISIPIIDMVEEATRRLCLFSPTPRRVGLIATIGTILSSVYSKSLSKKGISLVLPKMEDQRQIQEAIDQVKVGVYDRATKETFQRAGYKLMREGAELVILGCTEVPLAFNASEVDYPVLNPTRVLAEAAVNWALEKD